MHDRDVPDIARIKSRRVRPLLFGTDRRICRAAGIFPRDLLVSSRDEQARRPAAASREASDRIPI